MGAGKSLVRAEIVMAAVSTIRTVLAQFTRAAVLFLVVLPSME
jgi:hypothetical protein